MRILKCMLVLLVPAIREDAEELGRAASSGQVAHRFWFTQRLQILHSTVDAASNNSS